MMNALIVTSIGTMLEIVQKEYPLIIKGVATTTIINLLDEKRGIMEEEVMKEEVMLTMIMIKSLFLKRDTKIQGMKTMLLSNDNKRDTTCHER